MGRLKNPHHVNPIDQFVVDNKAAIDAFLLSNVAVEFFTYDQIRAEFPAKSAMLTDGMIDEIANSLGIEVLP